MPGQIKVDFGSLAELQSQVNSSAQKILTEIEDLKRIVNGTQAYWDGSARDQFGVRYAQLETAQKNVQEAIGQFGDLVCLDLGQRVELAGVAVGREHTDAAVDESAHHRRVGRFVDVTVGVERGDRNGHHARQPRT